ILDDLLRRRVRERAEHEIERLACPVDRLERAQVGQRERRELRKHVAHLLAGAPVRRQRRNRHTRMPQEEPNAFGPGVAGGAEDADFRLVSHGRIPVVQCDRTMTRWILEDRRRGPSSGGVRVSNEPARRADAAATQSYAGHRHGGAYRRGVPPRQSSKTLKTTGACSQSRSRGRPARAALPPRRTPISRSRAETATTTC